MAVAPLVDLILEHQVLSFGVVHGLEAAAIALVQFGRKIGFGQSLHRIVGRVDVGPAVCFRASSAAHDLAAEIDQALAVKTREERVENLQRGDPGAVIGDKTAARDGNNAHLAQQPGQNGSGHELPFTDDGKDRGFGLRRIQMNHQSLHLGEILLVEIAEVPAAREICRESSGIGEVFHREAVFRVRSVHLLNDDFEIDHFYLKPRRPQARCHGSDPQRLQGVNADPTGWKNDINHRCLLDEVAQRPVSPLK